MSGFLPPIRMKDGTNDLRLFEELRFHPWKDQDKLQIDAHLAMLYVTDKEAAERYQKAYDQKMLDYIARKNEESGVTPPPLPETGAPITMEMMAAHLKQPEKKENKPIALTEAPKKKKKLSPLLHGKPVSE